MKKKTIYILGLIMTLGFMSCDDYLDVTPDNRASLDSDVKVKELLTSAYPELGYGLFSFSMSDNARDKGIGHMSDMSNTEGYFWKDFTSTTQDSPSGFWDACYNCIATANQSLKYIEENKVDNKIPDNLLPFYGEALLIRAYNHFMLVNFFGKHYNPDTASEDLGVPYVTEVEDVVFKNYKRSTVQEVYDFIETDFKEGIKYIDDTSYDSPKFHMNYAASCTFISRFYLYKREWTKVVEYATEALGNNTYAKLRDLTGKYGDLGVNEQAAEYSKSTEAANFLITSKISIWFHYFQATLRYTYNAEIEDLLYKNIFLTDGKEWAQASANFGTTDPVIVKWGFFFKQSGINADVGYYYAISPDIVAEEALFNRIEANIMLRDYTSAEDDFNKYFEKRITGYDDTNKISEAKIDAHYKDNSRADSPLNPNYDLDEKQRTYLNCVIDTRRREFIYNGLRWFDIKRFNMKVIHNIDEGSPIELTENDNRKVLQIPIAAQLFGIQPNAR